MHSPAGLGMFLYELISRLLSVYSLLILVRALLSWFSISPYNKFYRFLIDITEPVLAPIRRIIPIQGIDLSPLVAILLIDIVIKRVVLAVFSSLFMF